MPVRMRWWFISKFCKSIETPQMEIRIADELERQFFDGSFGILTHRLNTTGYMKYDNIGGKHNVVLISNDERFRSKYTCSDCSAAYPKVFGDSCPYVWDDYNKNGDCLAIK